MSHVILCRHGESDLNFKNKRRRVFNGQAETPLTELGERQAAEAGRIIARMPGVRIAYAVSSTIGRAVDSLRFALEQIPYEVTVLPPTRAFNERSLGIFEGQPADEIFARYPEYEVNPDYNRFQLHFTQKAPKGENLTEVTDRAWGEFQSLEERFDGDKLILFHGITMRCLLGKILGLTQEQIIGMEIPNAVPIVLKKEAGYSLASDFRIE